MRHSKTFFLGVLVVPVAAVGLAVVFASDVTIPNNFTANTPAVAAEVNANFMAVEAAVDDNDARLDAIEGSSSCNQTVSKLVRFTGLAAGIQSMGIYVRTSNTATATSVTLNRGNFTQELLIQEEGSATITRLSYSGSDTDTTLNGTYELLRTIGNYNKIGGAGVDLLVTWNAHIRVEGPPGTFADFQVREDGNAPALDGNRCVLYCD